MLVLMLLPELPAAATVIESGFWKVAAGDAPSETCTVNVYVPDVVGVPVMEPAVLRLRPPGREPDATVKLYEPTPPEATTVWEYEAPTVAFGSEAVDMVSELAGGVPAVAAERFTVLMYAVPQVAVGVAATPFT